MKIKTIHEAGTTNPVKRSLTVRDDRKVMFEDTVPVNGYAIHETIKVTFTNKIVEGASRGSDYRTISNRN